MKKIFLHIDRQLHFLVLALLLVSGPGFQAFAQYEPSQPFKGKLGTTLAETEQAWPEFTKARKDAPNVIYILIDDIGFAAASAFGGLIPTPTFDSLANAGLRYTNFHTNGVCSPTRAGLLTGRNSHSVHIGSNAAAGTPGYDRYMPFTKATIADVLRENGYNTYAVGKWHLTPSSNLTQAGPFNRYPTGRGFDHYFGFLGGATDQYHPQLWDDTRKIELSDNNKTHITTLLTNKAISYITEQKSLAPEKPFFLYYAPGATHSPHQVDKHWVDRFKGKFDAGWDKYREDALANQIKLGVVPPNTVLPPRDKNVKSWNELSASEKKLAIRHFEVYAGFLAHTDYEIGRLINFLKEIDQLDNTLIYLSIGDNGASKAGAQFGRVKIYDPSLNEEQRLQQSVKDIDLIGTEDSNSDYPLGWAQAANTPFRYFKADANSEGGTHNPLIVFWPAGIKERGVRTQYSHITDITPTTLELLGVRAPSYINGYQQEPFEGTSFAYSVANAKAPGRKTVQYYEINGSRSIYKEGWKAAAYHERGKPFSSDQWELFNLNDDYNERFDLSAKYPEKLKELQEQFDAEAAKYNVYPLKDGTEPTPRTPTAFDGKSQFVFYPGISQITEVPAFINRSFAIVAHAEIPASGAEGVLLSLGGRPGGISFFVQNKKLQVVYNFGADKNVITSTRTLPAGKVELRYEFESDGDPVKGTGTGTLFINGVKAGEGRIAKPARGSAYEGLSIGKDIVTPVSDTYKVPYEFTGKIKSVSIELKEKFNVASK